MPDKPRTMRLAPQSPGTSAKLPSDLSLQDIGKMEQNAINKANNAISAIENAMAVWDSSTDKPEDLKPRIVRLRFFYDAVMNWEREMLQVLGRNDLVESRVERLKEFTDICLTYA